MRFPLKAVLAGLLIGAALFFAPFGFPFIFLFFFVFFFQGSFSGGPGEDGVMVTARAGAVLQEVIITMKLRPLTVGDQHKPGKTEKVKGK